MKVAVIGGGISGLSTARLLNDKGHIVMKKKALQVD